VGDNLDRDIVGAKAAGIGMTIGVRYPEKKPQEVTPENQPDQFITHFKQLLDIFPQR
jgi:FMN phosphatase YigB (HAD superfamily)